MKTNEFKMALDILDDVIADQKPDIEQVLEVRVAVRKALKNLSRQADMCSKLTVRPKPKKKKAKKAKRMEARA